MHDLAGARGEAAMQTTHPWFSRLTADGMWTSGVVLMPSIGKGQRWVGQGRCRAASVIRYLWEAQARRREFEAPRAVQDEARGAIWSILTG